MMRCKPRLQTAPGNVVWHDLDHQQRKSLPLMR